MPKDDLDKQKRFSRVGVIVVAVVLLLCLAALVMLFQRPRKVEELNVVTTTSGSGTTATYTAGESQQAYFTASPGIIQPGKQAVTLDWNMSGAKLVRIEGLPGTFTASGRHILQADHPLLIKATPEGRTFTLKAEMSDGSVREAKAGVEFVGKFVQDGEGTKK